MDERGESYLEVEADHDAPMLAPDAVVDVLTS
jgi:hypothetical protein